jgi:hypothetical protein
MGKLKVFGNPSEMHSAAGFHERIPYLGNPEICELEIPAVLLTIAILIDEPCLNLMMFVSCW